ncbi:MAG: hypothetical protein ABWY54_07010 [Glaciihabitans sp.]
MTNSAAFGIAAQVVLRDASPTDPSPWPGEPGGIIVRAAGSAIQGVWGRTGGGRLWWIEFDEPQPAPDGSGLFATAQVHEKYLELAPFFVDQDGAESSADGEG